MIDDKWRTLREKYGRSKKTRQLINAAIRAELVGGDDLLDALERVHRMYVRLHEHEAGKAESSEALDALMRAREAMAAVIARRYNLDAPTA